MRISGRVALALTFVLAGSAFSGDKPKAADLVKRMQGALASLYKAIDAANPPGVKEGDKRVDLLAMSFKKADEALADVSKGLQAKKDSYFKALHRLGGALYEMDAAWRSLGAKDANVDGRLKGLLDAYDAFHAQYGRAAVAKKHGGALTDKEKAELERLRKQNAAVLARLNALGPKVKASPAIAAQIALLVDWLSAPQWTAEVSWDVYFWSYDVVERMEGVWDWTLAYVHDVEPSFVADFRSVHHEFRSYEAEYWTAEELVVVESSEWSAMDVEMEVAVDLPAELSSEEYAAFEQELASVEVAEEEYMIAEDDEPGADGAAGGSEGEDENHDGVPDEDEAPPSDFDGGDDDGGGGDGGGD